MCKPRLTIPQIFIIFYNIFFIFFAIVVISFTLLNLLLDISIITLEEENYLNWKNDDQYIIDYIKTQLNIL